MSFVSPSFVSFVSASPQGTLRVSGKQNSLFPLGPVIKCFVIPPDSKIEKKLRKSDLLDAYSGCACSMSGSLTELFYRNDTITVFSSQLTKIKTILKLLCLLLMLNSRILGLI